MKLIVIFLCSLLSIKSCTSSETIKGNGNVVSEEILITDYSGLDISIPSEIIYESTSKVAPYFKIETDTNILEELIIETKDEVLIIKPIQTGKLKRKNLRPTKCIIHTNSSSLSSVKKRGSGKVVVKDSLKTDELKFAVAGSGDIITEYLECSKLSIDIAGSGDIRLNGKANDTKIKIAGSGKVKAYNMQTNKLRCEIAGSGDIQANVTEHLNISIAGSGDVKYKGSPEVKKKIAGSGSVTQIK